MPYNKYPPLHLKSPGYAPEDIYIIDQASSVKMAGYGPRSLLGFYGPRLRLGP